MALIAWRRLQKSPVRDQIRADWLAMLEDRTSTEHRYLKFLQDHAGLFFPRSLNREDVVISELRLGADYRPDFVIARSDRSYGFVYRLIELESPHAAAYNKEGIPSASLTLADGIPSLLYAAA